MRIQCFFVLTLGLLPLLQASLVGAEAFWNSPVWKNPENGATQRFFPLKYVENETWYDSHFWIGSEKWTRIGNGWLHPGYDAPAVLTFTAPKDGNVAIRGNVKKLHLNGDGVLAKIELNGSVLWEKSIEGKDGVGVAHDLQKDLKEGDQIRFIVSCGPSITCDTTGWNPEIVYSDKTFRASEGFAQNETKAREKQTENLNAALVPWSYFTEREKELTVVKTVEELAFLRDSLKAAVDGGLQTPKDPLLWSLILLEWKRDDAPDGFFSFDKDEDAEKAARLVTAAGKHLVGMRRLHERIASEKEFLSPRDAEYLTLIEKKLSALETECLKWTYPRTEKISLEQARTLYFQTRIWKRELVFTNPLVKNCGQILFVKRKPTSYDHLVMQYFGWRAQRGGSALCILKEPGRSLEFEDVLKGKMDGGNIADPCLSWDGKKILFAWVELDKENKRFPWDKIWIPQSTNENEKDDREYYHIYEVNADGTGLRQLTRGNYEDLMPAYLPNGEIVFVSSRRKGHARCFWWGFGERWTTFTVHKMNADGENVATLSWHDTNEWYPTVGHDGQIFYARWDYIDRDAVTHQNLWSMRPDGANPTAVWGNASLDIFCSFQAKPIPNSRKWVLTASAHHACTGGSLVILDPSVAKDGPDAIERLTPEIPFPEAEGNDVPKFYASPWPLSEDFYLAAFSPFRLEFEPKATRDNALGLYVYDRFGNRELLYRDPSIGSDSPQPLASRKTPPILPSLLPENPKDEGRFFVQDVYQGLGESVKRGSIKALRIVQIFPKTTLTANDPPIGLAGEENGRAVLGTVPVEEDGSVNFIAPARRPLLFQALNEKGEAFQIMRTLTYLQPGEEIACIGCHEAQTNAVGGNSPYVSLNAEKTGKVLPLAAVRPPSEIKPGKFDGRPFSFMEIVQPLLNAKCVSCHGANPDHEVFRRIPQINLTDEPDGKFVRSYVSLMKDETLIPRWKQRNRIETTEPGGKHGAIGSGLKRVLADKNHESVQLTDDEWARIAMWIDQNAIFYGTTQAEDQKLQIQGKPVPMQTLR